MLETLMSSNIVKFLGLVVITLSFGYIIKNPNKKLIDIIRPKALRGQQPPIETEESGEPEVPKDKF
ncbi:MAG: hypothetical protein PHH48_07050 [Eubacteriales bacterium]|nr:hypothetical protein [Eubacteriales bacterium]